MNSTGSLRILNFHVSDSYMFLAKIRHINLFLMMDIVKSIVIFVWVVV